MAALTLGYSPCPNDTFIFYGLVHNKIAGAPRFREVLEDIETLNAMAVNDRLDMTKISFHALGHLRERYCLLHAGGALGRGCGPLLISRAPIQPDDLRGKKIAIPGKLTTAALLLRLFNPDLEDLVVLPFHKIMSATQDGEVDAGLIIHESRFTYPDYGLHKVIDLGEWWESATGHPIPLGGILARRSLGSETIANMDRSLRESIAFAYTNPEEVKQYIRQHAQEMDDAVMQQHIDLYVNDHTRDYNRDGEAAIADLYRRAEAAGILPPSKQPLFID
ncbi:MAG: 1,4-dihydroxy-6-naphthoate synthase [bacterium]|nr:1,4-dihydroxy-6-naphthoate synthase [bacterium]